MNMTEDFGAIIAKVRETKPVIHHITNYVTAESCADICLAAGGSPVMADDPAEVEDITANANALVLNLGTMSASRMEAMEFSAVCAKANNIPVVLDPVGVMSSPARLSFARRLLEAGFISIVRGNFSECLALVTGEVVGKGVDNLAKDDEQTAALRIAQEGAKKYGCIFAVTGAVDHISNGKQAVMLNNGHPLLEDITGSGCMCSSLVATCAAVAKDNLMVAAACGVVVMGQSAELAANFLEKKDGPGMFKVRLIDGVYHVTTKWNLVHLEPETKAN